MTIAMSTAMPDTTKMDSGYSELLHIPTCINSLYKLLFMYYMRKAKNGQVTSCSRVSFAVPVPLPLQVDIRKLSRRP